MVGVFVAVVLAGSRPLWAGDDKIRVVATTSTFASLVESVTGDRAEIYFIASPRQDIHYVAPTPKDILKLKKADVFVHGGLDLEMWRDPVIDASGRREFMRGGSRSIDLSEGIVLLEVPEGLSRVEGDIHQFGNPHYWLDPGNAKVMADHLERALSQYFPAEASFFSANASRFKTDLEREMIKWEKRLSPFRGKAVVAYHKTWTYFASRFGLLIAEYLEPKPGIPPTPRHIGELIRTMKEQRVGLIVKETFFEGNTPRKVADAAGARVVDLVQAVGELEEIRDYLAIFEYNTQVLEDTRKR